MVLLTTIFLAFVFVFLLKCLAKIRYDKRLKKYPCPDLITLFKAIFEVHRTENFLPILLQWTNDYGKIFKLSLGFGPRVLMISDVNFIERLLGGNEILKKAQNYYFLKRWLGTGLLTSVGDKWKKHRKLITPAFHFKILEQFPKVFDYNGNILIKKLNSKVSVDSVDIYPFITLCTLDIICETAMGISINAQTDSKSEYVRSVRDMCRIIRNRTVSPIKIYEIIYRYTKDYRDELNALQIIHSFTNKVIKERKANLHVDKGEFFKLDDFGRKRKATLLDLLLQYQMNGQTITDQEINEEVHTFLFEGHDTVSSATSFALYNIAQHPHVQVKIVEELKVIFGDDFNRSATYQDLSDMKYLEAVIKETLRLYPAVPVYGRSTEEEIHFDDVNFPRALNLMVCPYVVHRQPELFPNPNKFDPERFLGDNLNNISPYAYIPFSAGSRNCIGQKFAMLEMKSLIAKVVRNFQLFPSVPEHHLEPYADIVLKSKTGMCIQLQHRI